MNTALLAKIMSEEPEIATILKEFDIEIVRSEEVIGGQELNIETQIRFRSEYFEDIKHDFIRSIIAKEIKDRISQQLRNPKNIKISIERFEISETDEPLQNCGQMFQNYDPEIKRISLRIIIDISTIRSAHQEYEIVMCNAVHQIDDSSDDSITHRVINFANTIRQVTHGVHETNVLILSQKYYQWLKYEHDKYNMNATRNFLTNLFVHIPKLKEIAVITEDENEDRGSGRVKINAICLRTRQELSEKKSDIVFFDSWENAIYSHGGIRLMVSPYTVAVLES